MLLYRDGTRVRAEGGDYCLEGVLVGDHDELDGVVVMLEDDDPKSEPYCD